MTALRKKNCQDNHWNNQVKRKKVLLSLLQSGAKIESLVVVGGFSFFFLRLPLFESFTHSFIHSFGIRIKKLNVNSQPRELKGWGSKEKKLENELNSHSKSKKAQRSDYTPTN